ncbi:c-type cytochrome [Aureivirga sp. CE67]|uniref:c-type cytochrome n=1 Tax=Aureivirga sp. CE67 TaxID=1788983 RepID=UPI0018C9269C|nr:cytochrome c [Aureivirga sp. CE67]
MKSVIKITTFLSMLLLIISCGSKEEKKTPVESKPVKTEKPVKINTSEEGTNLHYKGVGEIKSVELGAIDQKMAEQGKEIFTAKCSACHKIGKKFIGPDLQNVMKRRSPEWVMNMILNPEKMTKEDPVAKQLLMDFNGAPMANQNLTKEETRTVVEYFRTLQK